MLDAVCGDIQFDFDATLMQRFEEAGLIAFARTTVPEFCMSSTTEAVRNDGPTRDPWDLGRIAGGASGGAAAAVAGGIVPIRTAATAGVQSGHPPPAAACSA